MSPMKASTVSTAPTKRVSMSDLHIDLIEPVENLSVMLTRNRVFAAAADPEFNAEEFRRNMAKISSATNRALNAINDLLNT